MRRVVLAVALVAVAVSLMGASVALGQGSIPTPYPQCALPSGLQAACGNGWYTTPISGVWMPNGTTPTAGCMSFNYSADTNLANVPDSALPAYAYCAFTYSDGTETFNGTATYRIKVELSSPTATATPARPPDSNGWYNHPVAGAISATSFSGIASCTSTTYSGPNTTSATVSGTCTDNAGKSVTVASAPFAYDATPPTLSATANPGDQSVGVSWQTAGDVAPVASIQVTRSGGTETAGVTTVYSGDGTGFEDIHVKNGVRYTYTVTARDVAGNVAATTITATPGARLLGPAPNAHLTAPPMLSWTSAPGATYYNVQLYRADRTKILSLWPVHANLQLHRTWRFGGHRYRLKPGRYKWYVWPGMGKRKAGRYGAMIGSGTFVVVR